MENQNKKNNAGTIALVVLLLIVTIAALVLATYAWAKYSAAPETNNATANVAKWEVNLTSDKSLFVQDYKHVVDDKIAPGTQGSFDVEIELGNTEVCVAYEVILNNITFKQGDAAATDTIKHLRFFRTNTNGVYSDEIAIPATGSSTMVLSGEIELDGTNHNTAPLNAVNETTQTAKDVTITKENGKTYVRKTIYWVWPYDKDDATAKYGASVASDVIESDAGAYDAADTAVGAGSVTSMEIGFTVKAWQVAPDDANPTAAGSKTQSTNK